MRFDDNYLLIDVPQWRRIWQLALYAVHLATGHTLTGLPIQADTISAYLRDVSKFLARYCDTDPRYVRPTDGDMAPPIKAIIDEVKRHEGMKNKREPYTLQMQDHIDKLVEDLLKNQEPTDGLLECLSDWYNNNLYMGCRVSEWAQKAGNTKLDQPSCDTEGVPLAFCLQDVSFYDKKGRPLSLSTVLSNPNKCERIKMQWSHQKNGNHGEQRLFTRNHKRKKRCFVLRMLRIIKRFVRLVGADKVDTPLAVYKHPTKGVIFITDNDIRDTLRSLACDVYGLDPEKDELKYSSHSLRVGACVILHAQGFSATQIKFLLRWRSDAFMEYLRNIAVLSEQQNQALNRLTEMPNHI